MGKFYREYADYLAERFEGKVQKLTVNANFTCPNRDGTRGRGGCTYCNNATFSPQFEPGRQTTVTAQLEQGKRFFSRKYPEMRYLAYFQSYTNTHSADIGYLENLYREALAVPDVAGLIIGTRPDCLPQELLRLLAGINGGGKRVMIELGAESSHDETLRRVNRCHTWAETVDAVCRVHEAGIDVGVHLIMGLPGEDTDMMLSTVDAVGMLPVDTVKFHQLQVVKGTVMAREYAEGYFSGTLFTPEEYLDLCVSIVDRLPAHIAIERFVSQSPADLLIAPKWGLKNYEFVNLLHRRLLNESRIKMKNGLRT